MPPEVVLATLRLVWTTLQSLNVPMALVGGLAMGAWQRPRFTKDIDLLLAISESDARRALGQLLAAGFRSKQAQVLVQLDDGSQFMQLIYDPPDALLDIQVDLLVATSAFHRQALARRVTLPASELGFEIAVVSCEDLIVLKLIVGRILDRADVAELLRANHGSLDLDYLIAWVAALHLQRLFREAWTDAFPTEAPPA